MASDMDFYELGKGARGKGRLVTNVLSLVFGNACAIAQFAGVPVRLVVRPHESKPFSITVVR